MEDLAYYNGTVTALDRATVPMLDRAVYFGDAVYDTTCSHDHYPFAIDDHVSRLFRSMGRLGIEPPMTRDGLTSLLCDLTARVDAGDAFVYWQVSRGTGIRDHVFPDGPANVMAMVTPQRAGTEPGGLRLVTEEDTRFLHCDVKTVNLIPSVMASERARRAGCQEAVFHRGDVVTECAHSNVHILEAGHLRTHPADNHILGGITRAQIIRICHEEGIPVDEEPFTVDELLAADEVIVSSCSKLAVCACEVDGTPVGGHAPDLAAVIHDRLVDRFLSETESRGRG